MRYRNQFLRFFFADLGITTRWLSCSGVVQPGEVWHFIHWGLYSIPARINEWYERHMYTTDVQWHTEHYGVGQVRI